MGRWAAEVQVDTMNSSHLAIGNSQDANNIWAHTKPSGKDVHVRMHARMHACNYVCMHRLRGDRQPGKYIHGYTATSLHHYFSSTQTPRMDGWLAGWVGWVEGMYVDMTADM